MLQFDGCISGTNTILKMSGPLKYNWSSELFFFFSFFFNCTTLSFFPCMCPLKIESSIAVNAAHHGAVQSQKSRALRDWLAHPCCAGK